MDAKELTFVRVKGKTDKGSKKLKKMDMEESFLCWGHEYNVICILNIREGDIRREGPWRIKESSFESGVKIVCESRKNNNQQIRTAFGDSS